MSKLHYTALSPEQMLERALGERTEINTRPRATPREVFAAWLGNFGVGVGGTIVAAVGLYATGAPETVLLSGSLMTGATVFAGMMIWHGSQDERADWRNVRQIKRAVKLIEAQHAGKAERLDTAYKRALDELDAADEEVSQLRRSLDQMTRERDLAIYDLTREREAAATRSTGRTNFVAPVELTPEEIRDATEMIRYRFDAGVHLSRRKAEESKRWSADRWKAAQAELVAARLITVNATQTGWIPQTLDEALSIFAEYLLHARALSVPAINKTIGKQHYVEQE